MIFKPITDIEKHKIGIDRDESVFKAYFVANYKVLKGYAMRILGDTHFAEDVASEVLWKLWHLGSDIVHIAALESYLLRSVKNKCLNLLRVRQLHYMDPADIKDTLVEWEHPQQLLMQEESLRRIENAIHSLSPKTKEAFLLVKEQRYSYKEVAEQLNISTKTVDRHVQIALQKLWLALKPRS